ncbi:Molybdenum cofactor sulfurase [Cytospora mali]|uniref:Molybdenum cofactor sulfurase n=1 Tax=Cytospora mali TaxID=578113 RepID=A0A194VPB3_CYTMA|nr:Molybdenum cofactor sulfurase [Valsa mali]
METPPGSKYNPAVDGFREIEYPMLKGSVYLDHAGTTLYPKSLMDRFASEMTASLLGNPHSASPSSQLSTTRIEDTRLRALQFFNADPAEFDLVFVANATAGIKLVAEALRASPGGFDYAYHQSSHTSLVGLREEARHSLCLNDAQVQDWLAGTDPFHHDTDSTCVTLFAYPGQSNMDGQRYPLDWAHLIRAVGRPFDSRCYTLLDAAALAATSPLDFSDSGSAADFTVVSFSKIFGFPDLGAVIVRREAEPAFAFRKYFGGGTVETVVANKEQWHASKTHHLHERLEDGTLPIHSIIALDIAMHVHREMFGSMSNVASHVSYLARRLGGGLRGLNHCNGTPVCEIYSPDNVKSTKAGAGPVIAFNIRNQAGAWISLAEVEKLASLKNFHIRTGGVCNPGGISSALNLQPWEIKRIFSAGFRCGSDNDIIAGKPTGIIRASLGAMSTVADVDAFIAFIAEFYSEQSLLSEIPTQVPTYQKEPTGFFVSDITVYPIKSCGGFRVPPNIDWEVRPEGFAWDREWCLVHKGSGQALSQKRYPKMALIRPVLDFEAGHMCIKYAGQLPEDGQRKEICVPLSSDPALFRSSLTSPSHRPLSSRVCGEEIVAETYISEEINDFFSAALGVPCMLARFPPGGQEGNKSARHAKAHLQKHQKTYYSNSESIDRAGPLPSGPPLSGAPPSPPDSDVEKAERRKILLSNESPILAINMASLRALNREIVERGGTEVSPDVFRANIVLDSAGTDPRHVELAYAEDNWSKIRIGQQDFKMLGSCRRCHMVCINQDTAEKSHEPFVTLSKTRRFEGKVFFGTHMCHMGQDGRAVSTREAQNPTVRVGDRMVIES